MKVKQYLAHIGRRGGQAGTGKSKARTTAQARRAARVRWREVDAARVASELADRAERSMKP